MTSSSSSTGQSRRLPSRGEVWLADLDPVRGHEQAGRRPVLIVSSNRLNQSGRGLVIVLPITSNVRAMITHVPLDPPEGGLDLPSVAMCEQVRAISNQRLRSRLGIVSAASLLSVARSLAAVLALPEDLSL